MFPHGVPYTPTWSDRLLDWVAEMFYDLGWYGPGALTIVVILVVVLLANDRRP